MRLPIRAVVCWTGGQKGNKQKGSAPGYKLQKRMRKHFPQKAKSEISNPVGKKQNKTETKTEKASETIIDTNDGER